MKGDSGYWDIRTIVTALGKVYSVDWTSDSSKLLACGENKKFQVWETTNYNQIGGNFDVGEIIWSCRFTSDDSVAVGLENGQVRIYSSTYTNSVIQTFTPSSSSKTLSLQCEDGTYNFIAAHENGKGYVTNDTNPLISDSNAMRAAAYSKTGDYFMVGGESSQVHIFEGPSHTETFTFTEPSKILSADFKDNG